MFYTKKGNFSPVLQKITILLPFSHLEGKMSMLGNAPQMSDEQVQQAQNQQMKDFLSTYNKTTQVNNLFLNIKL